MLCRLDGAAINLERLRRDTRGELLNLLDDIGGQQCLVFDVGLCGRLNHVFDGGVAALRAHGVLFFRELGPELGTFETPPEHVIYLVHTEVKSMLSIANHVKVAMRDDQAGKGSPPKFHIFMVPRTTLLCTQVLEDELILPYVQLGAYHLDAICLDVDVISLELEQCLLDVKINGDPTALECVAQALLRLEHLYGTPRRIWTLGAAARGVAERLARASLKAQRARRTGSGGTLDTIQRIFGSAPPHDEFINAIDTLSRAEIDTLVLVDRDIDLVTPMVTPLTYEGLVDEVMGGIRNGCVRLPRNILGDNGDSSPSTAPQGDDVAFALNSNDALYAEVRDLNVEQLGAHLGEQAKAIRGSYDTFRSNKDASITEIHEFVKRIPGLTQVYRSLQTHINITERIKRTTDSREFRDRWNTERALLEGDEVYDQIEELIATQEPPMSLLRLLCLQSLSAGGVRGTKYNLLRREVLQTYGFELIGTIDHLERVGLLAKVRDGVASNLLGGVAETAPFAALRRVLQLIVDDVNPHVPADMAYVSSGYAPLSCRLIERLATLGAQGLTAALPYLPGAPHLAYAPRDFDRANLVEAFDQKDTVALTVDASFEGPLLPALRPDGSKPVMLVCYVGGVTYAEIAALRFLARKPSFPFTFLIATTAIVNGTSLITSLQFKIHNRLRSSP
mmetsp:Transcript_16768/g.50067  ORF Transcript_16768/g.50067 Transcript_16768/m.50067 type:complete len:677 (+) Transcript_16768:183-2213(+)